MYIKSLNLFKSDYKYNNIILENMNIGYDDLIDSIKATKVDYIDNDKLYKILDPQKSLEEIVSKANFRNYWDSLGMYSSEIFNSDDFSTFLNRPLSFIFIYEEGDVPVYLLIKNNIGNSSVILYEVGEDDINDFLDKLSSKTIFLEYNNITYTYQTSNGENWVKIKGRKNKLFPNELDMDEIKDLANVYGVKTVVDKL